MANTCGCAAHIYKEKLDFGGGAQLSTMLNSRASPLPVQLETSTVRLNPGVGAPLKLDPVQLSEVYSSSESTSLNNPDVGMPSGVHSSSDFTDFSKPCDKEFTASERKANKDILCLALQGNRNAVMNTLVEGVLLLTEAIHTGSQLTGDKNSEHSSQLVSSYQHSSQFSSDSGTRGVNPTFNLTCDSGLSNQTVPPVTAGVPSNIITLDEKSQSVQQGLNPLCDTQASSQQSSQSQLCEDPLLEINSDD